MPSRCSSGMPKTHKAVAAACLAGILGVAGVSFGGSGYQAHDASQPAGQGSEEKAREKPVGLGETMPAFTLQNEMGEPVSLSEALANGPIVLTFYRGKWCPYCVKALKSLETSVSDVNKLGATVYAISPQTPEYAIDLRKQTGLSYELLVDQDNRLAERLGLMFELDEKTVERYGKYGIDVPEANGTDTWELPIPATYVIDTEGVVRYAWTNEDYSKRAPISQVLKALREIDG